MAQVNQDFITYQGDTVSPIITVRNSAGQPVNISTVTNITWNARRNEDEAPVITKTKQAGQITFVTDGSDGKFQISIMASDTNLLSGNYLHEAIVVDNANHATTVTIGRMQVGIAPQWTYDPTMVGIEDLYTVRNLCGDTLMGDQQLSDAEVNWTVDTYSNVWLAAAQCCRMIAARYARMVDTVQGELRTMYSARTKRYSDMADGVYGLQSQGMARGGGAFCYAGGISVTDKQTQEADTDRVQPQFTIGEFDNFYPIGPAAHETLSGATESGQAMRHVRS